MLKDPSYGHGKDVNLFQKGQFIGMNLAEKTSKYLKAKFPLVFLYIHATASLDFCFIDPPVCWSYNFPAVSFRRVGTCFSAHLFGTVTQRLNPCLLGAEWVIHTQGLHTKYKTKGTSREVQQKKQRRVGLLNGVNYHLPEDVFVLSDFLTKQQKPCQIYLRTKLHVCFHQVFCVLLASPYIFKEQTLRGG